MLNFTKNELNQKLTQIENAESLNDFASEHNLKVSFENDAWECSFDCFVDGDESSITIKTSDTNCEYDIWIDGEEYFINEESQLEKFN